MPVMSTIKKANQEREGTDADSSDHRVLQHLKISQLTNWEDNTVE